MRQLVLIFVVIISLFSCEKPVKKTDLVMKKSKFVEVLTDFYLYNNMTPGITKVSRINYEDADGYLLQKHQITLDEFSDSYKYYMLNKSSWEEINKKVEKKLLAKVPNYDEKQAANENKGSLQTPKNKKLPNSDSIKNTKPKFDSIPLKGEDFKKSFPENRKPTTPTKKE